MSEKNTPEWLQLFTKAVASYTDSYSPHQKAELARKLLGTFTEFHKEQPDDVVLLDVFKEFDLFSNVVSLDTVPSGNGRSPEEIERKVVKELAEAPLPYSPPVLRKNSERSFPKKRSASSYSYLFSHKRRRKQITIERYQRRELREKWKFDKRPKARFDLAEDGPNVVEVQAIEQNGIVARIAFPKRNADANHRVVTIPLDYSLPKDVPSSGWFIKQLRECYRTCDTKRWPEKFRQSLQPLLVAYLSVKQVDSSITTRLKAFLDHNGMNANEIVGGEERDQVNIETEEDK